MQETPFHEFCRLPRTNCCCFNVEKQTTNATILRVLCVPMCKMHPSTNSQQHNNMGSRVNILAISHLYFLYVGCQFIVIDKIAIPQFKLKLFM